MATDSVTVRRQRDGSFLIATALPEHSILFQRAAYIFNQQHHQGRHLAMLDTFEILTTSGVVLWSRTYAAVSPSVVNNFINDIFIEEKSSVAGAKNGASAAENPPYKHDQHTLRWTFEKELGIIFVVGSTLRANLFYP